MPVPASAPDHPLFLAVAKGVGWGVVAAGAIALVCAVWLGSAGGMEPLTAILAMLYIVAFAIVAAALLATFPIGPVAALIGWLMYRSGMTSPWAYAVAGAVSAATAPLLIILVANETSLASNGTNSRILADGVAVFLGGVTTAVGAFGGFMAGRALRSGAS